MSRASRLPPLSETQLEIMSVVWERREASVAEVWGDLTKHRPLARTTVHTLVTRLAEKGWLKQRKRGNGVLFKAAVPRETTVRGMVHRLMETAFRGSAEGLILAMLDGRGLSNEEAERIRKLIDGARGKQP